MIDRLNRVQKGARVTIIGLFINIILTIIKLLAGIIGKSGALIADAAHSASDFISDLVVLFGIRMAERPPDKTHDYGHGKFETLSAGLLGAMLFLVGLGILVSGILKIGRTVQGQHLARPGWIAFGAALLSIIVKEWMYHYTVRVWVLLNSKAVIANAWHHRSDALSSVATVFGVGGAILLGEHWRVLDPIAAIAVSFMVVRVAMTIFMESLNELLEASESEEVENSIRSVIREVPGVESLHKLKTRKVGGRTTIYTSIQIAGLQA